MRQNKILLVDDDREFRKEFKDSFEEYEVIEAASGEEALEVLNKPNEIDLVMLDVRMPGICGVEILNRIKETAPDLGIIILTAHSSEDVAIKALKGHADDYIEKPFDVEEVRGVIERLLESKNSDGSVMADDIAAKIEKVKHFVERNCHKKVCLEDAAQAVSLSPKYLSRIFKSVTGIGFNRYKLKIKIGESKRLLKNTSLNINQVSDKIGYRNTESFIRIFEKFTRLTPTGYRRKKRRWVHDGKRK